MFLDATSAPPAVPMTYLGLMILLVQFISGCFHWFTTKASKADRAKMAADISVVSAKTDDIYKMVNHPLGVALVGNAVAMERIAHMTRDGNDILLAVEARKRADEHIARQAQIDAAKVRDDQEKQQIIDKFLKDQQDSKT